MNAKPCPYEDAVTAAASSGDWTPELSGHRDGCMRCAELSLVVVALVADAEVMSDESIALPDPGLIWMRSRLAARERKFRRATQGIVLVQRAAMAVAAAIGLAFAPGLWNLVKGVFAGLSIGSPVAGLPRAAGSPLLVLIVSLTVLGLLAISELTATPES
jgi:hypothetical protein